MDSAGKNLHSVSLFQMYTLTKLPTAPSIMNMLENTRASELQSACFQGVEHLPWHHAGTGTWNHLLKVLHDVDCTREYTAGGGGSKKRRQHFDIL